MGGDGGGPLDLAAGPPLRPTGRDCRRMACLPLLAPLPPALLSFFFLFVGMGDGLSPTLTPAQMLPFPLSHRRSRKGGGQGRAPPRYCGCTEYFA